MLIRPIRWRLPLDQPWDMRTIPFGYCRWAAAAKAPIATTAYKHDLASADLRKGAGTRCPIYFVNSWALCLSHITIEAVHPSLPLSLSRHHSPSLASLCSPHPIINTIQSYSFPPLLADSLSLSAVCEGACLCTMPGLGRVHTSRRAQCLAAKNVGECRVFH